MPLENGTMALVAVLLVGLLAVTQSSPARPASVGTAAALDELLLEYDSNIRPPGDGPTEVGVTTAITIAEWCSNRLSITYFFKRKWNDSRLKFKGYKEIRVAMPAKIWEPALYSPVEIDFQLLNDGYILIKPDGEVSSVQRGTSVLPCILTADDVYMHDGKLNCTFSIGSFGHSSDEVLLRWDKPPTINKAAQKQCSLVHSDEIVTPTSSGNYSQVCLTLEVNTGVTKALLDHVIQQMTTAIGLTNGCDIPITELVTLTIASGRSGCTRSNKRKQHNIYQFLETFLSERRVSGILSLLRACIVGRPKVSNNKD